jgi:hypothetical protein
VGAGLKLAECPALLGALHAALLVAQLDELLAVLLKALLARAAHVLLATLLAALLVALPAQGCLSRNWPQDCHRR